MPDAGKVLLSDYGTAWIEERPTSARRPSVCTATCFRRHIQPHFAAKAAAEIKRTWLPDATS